MENSNDNDEKLKKEIIQYYQTLEENKKNYDNSKIKEAPYRILMDDEFMKELIKIYPRALVYASNTLHNDDDIVFEVLNVAPDVIQHVGDKYKNDKNVMMKVLSKNPSLIRNISVNSPLLDDDEIARIVIDKHGSIERLSDRIKANKEFARMAVENNYNNFQYISDELKADNEFVLMVLENKGELLEYMPSKIKNNKSCVLKAVTNNGNALRWASKKLRGDITVIKKAMESSLIAYRFISDEVLDDEEIKKLLPEKYSDIWWDDNELSQKMQQPTPTEEQVMMVESKCGYRLPKSYIDLMKKHNGGRLKARYIKISNYKYIEIDAIFSIADESISDSILFRKTWAKEWEYPDIGLMIASTVFGGHVGVMLDYMENGKDGEPKVVMVDNENNNKQTIIAESFSEFLSKLCFEEEIEK